MTLDDFRKSLTQAKPPAGLTLAHAISSVAFPSIATGAHGYPAGKAAQVAVSAVAAALASTSHVSQVRFVLFDAATLRAYVAAGEEYAFLRNGIFSTHDGLTGLNSRRSLFADLHRLLQGTEQRLAVLKMDIDSFKVMNDQFGHGRGDKTLRAVAQLLSRRAGSYRYGGDEFVCVAPLVDRRDALSLAESVRSDVEDLGLKLTVSVGLAISPQDGKTPEEILRNAESAMYTAKHDGGNCVRTCGDVSAKRA